MLAPMGAPVQPLFARVDLAGVVGGAAEHQQGSASFALPPHSPKPKLTWR